MTWYRVPAGTEGDHFAKNNLTRTIENKYPIGEHFDLIRDENVQKELQESGLSEMVHMWAAKEGTSNKRTWEGMKRGDRVIFYSQGRCMYLGTVLTKEINFELGEKVWPPEGGPIYGYVYFLVDVQKIDVDGASINKLFGYTNGPQGFTTIAKDKLQNVIDRFGSVEKAMESLMGDNRILSTELDRLDKKDDDDYQSSIESVKTPVEPMEDRPLSVPEQSSSSGRRKSRKRDAAIALRAVMDANYKCEIDPEHKTFLSKATGKPFVEAHHLIPMAVQDQFSYSLDVPANIVSLCPNCHRAFHHALPKERQALIYKVYHERKNRLRKCKIAPREEELLNYYV